MSRFNTGNPLGSTDVKDLSDNAKNLDLAVNDITNQTWADRFGVQRKTLYGIESTADDLFESIENRANSVIESLGFFPPVPYAPGLNVDSSNFTVEHDGVIYFARPQYTPFVTAAWDASYWEPLQNTFNKNNLLVFENLSAAQNAASMLPSGQPVEVFENGVITRYIVQSGALVEEPQENLREDLSNSDGPSSGSSLVGHDGESVYDVLNKLVVRQTGEAGGMKVPSGDEASRPVYEDRPIFRHSTTTGEFEINFGDGWRPFIGVSQSTFNKVPGTLVNGMPLPKFGNMTGGAGLSALFDSSSSAQAYSETTSGFAGVELTSARQVLSIEIVSGDNGFDGSGTANTATISLYGKNGSAPTSATDGTLLNTTTKTDTNTKQTVTLNGNSLVNYKFIWVRIQTAVWAAATSLNIFTSKSIETPGEGNSVYLSSCDQLVPLVSAGVEISQFRIPLHLKRSRVILLDFHSDVIHTGVGGDAGVAVGFSFYLNYRSGSTPEQMAQASFTNIRNAVGGGNVSEYSPQHYGNKSITSAIMLPAGYHEFSVIGNGHTDGSSTQGILKILAEGGMGLNSLRATVLP